jgi:pimeloyl-ACP methyl ester carboxylesterase
LYRGFADRAPADTSRITCPVDVLWGDRDAIFQRETQDLLVSRLRGSALTVIPDVGHAVHWEMPGALVRAIDRRAAGC